ncbi:MAG: hypothetical protein K2P31_02720 [Rickettsiaceae bacterium]|nr:hypothetical protein [Rickettsiaceae bacterium]
MQHYLECGEYMARNYGHYENGFYSSMLIMFKDAMKIVKNNPSQTEAHFKALKRIAKKCSSAGWELERYL